MAIATTRAARPRRFEGSDPQRLQRFPEHAATRWLLRLAIAAPFAAIAIVASTSPDHAALQTPNNALAAHVGGLALDEGAAELGVLYPPLTTIGAMLLMLLPFGSVSLGVAGSIVAGVMLQRLAELMRRRRIRPYGRFALIASLVATPLFAYLVTTDLAAIVALWLFALGISDLVRFVAFGNTQAGFRAGLLLAGAALSSPMGIVYVLVAVVVTPLIRASWVGNRARVSNIVVVGFPSVGAFAAAMLLAWAFAGSPFAIFPADVGFDAARVDELVTLFSTAQGITILAPLAAGILGAIIVRRAAAAPLAILLVLGVLAGRVFHLLPDGSAGLIYALTLIVTIAVLPAAQSTARAVGITAIVLLQIPFGWIDALQRTSVRAWLDVLTGVLS